MILLSGNTVADFAPGMQLLVSLERESFCLLAETYVNTAFVLAETYVNPVL